MAKNKELDAKEIEARVHDLSKSIEEMKSLNAERDDVVVELQQSQLTRLEMLARDLQSVFDQVPDDNDQFEFALTNGENPRLWIDMTTHVRMGTQRHQYELVKDTRMGRTILASSADKNQMGQVITDYIADKMLERERMIEGEWIAMGGYEFDATAKTETKPKMIMIKDSPWKSVTWFVLGTVLGAAALFIWAWYDQLPSVFQ